MISDLNFLSWSLFSNSPVFLLEIMTAFTYSNYFINNFQNSKGLSFISAMKVFNFEILDPRNGELFGKIKKEMYLFQKSANKFLSSCASGHLLVFGLYLVFLIIKWVINNFLVIFISISISLLTQAFHAFCFDMFSVIACLCYEFIKKPLGKLLGVEPPIQDYAPPAAGILMSLILFPSLNYCGILIDPFIINCFLFVELMSFLLNLSMGTGGLLRFQRKILRFWTNELQQLLLPLGVFPIYFVSSYIFLYNSFVGAFTFSNSILSFVPYLYLFLFWSGVIIISLKILLVLFCLLFAGFCYVLDFFNCPLIYPSTPRRVFDDSFEPYTEQILSIEDIKPPEPS